MSLNLSAIKKLFKKSSYSIRDDKDVEDAKRCFSNLLSSARLPKGIDVKELFLPIDVIKPNMAVKDVVAFYVMGSGFVLGSREAYRCFVATLSDLFSMEVYLPEYRISQEYSFFDAIDELCRAYKFMLDREYRKVFLIADGAGAYLSIKLLEKMRKESVKMPDKIAFISPFLDLSCSNLAVENKKKDFVFTTESLSFFASYILKNKSDDPSPTGHDIMIEVDLLRNKELFTNLPPIIVQVASSELLYNDSIRMKEVVQEVGGRLELEVYKDAFHMFQAFEDDSMLSYTACTSLSKRLKD